MAFKATELASQDLFFLIVPWELAFQPVITRLGSQTTCKPPASWPALES